MDCRCVGAVMTGFLVLAAPAAGLAEPSGPTPAMIARTTPPLPPPRPDSPAASSPAAPPVEAPSQADVGPAPAQAPQIVAEGAACRERLTHLGVRFETRPALRNGTCGTPEPVLVSGLPEGIEVSPAATMTCPMAEALARWSVEVLKVEAERHFQSAPTKLVIGTSYECRNQRSGGKMSEHAFANGIDLTGLAFAKRPNLPIGFHGNGSPDAAFQSAIQKGACPYFTTVLGPGSDAAHGDHLHLDMRGRRAGYRICQ